MIERSRSRRPEERFQLRKRELDWIEVGTVGRQKPKVRTHRCDRRANRRLFVCGEVVQDDHVAASKRRREDLFDIGQKRRVVDRAVKHGRCAEPVGPQRRNDGVRFPMTARRVIAEPGADGTAAVAAQQIRGHATFVEKHILPGIPQRLPASPLPARGGDIRPALFVGVYRFF